MLPTTTVVLVLGAFFSSLLVTSSIFWGLFSFGICLATGGFFAIAAVDRVPTVPITRLGVGFFAEDVDKGLVRVLAIH